MSEPTIDVDAADAAAEPTLHFRDDPVEVEFARLRGETPDPVEEPPAVDVDAELERVALSRDDLREASDWLKENPEVAELLPEPTTAETLRGNVLTARAVEVARQAQEENQGLTADAAFNEARAALAGLDLDEDSEDGDYEDGVAAQASALLETAGPDDWRTQDFVRQWAEQDEDAASSWVAQANAHQAEAQAIQNALATQGARDQQRLFAEQVQAEKDKSVQEFDDRLGELKKSPAFKTLEPIMQELALRSAQDNPDWLLYRGAEAVDDLARSAFELHRAETSANIRNEIMGATPFDTLDEGMHKFGEEPPGSSRPLAVPKVNVRNVTPKDPGRDRMAEFRAFLHDDPISEEFERMRRGA